MKYVRNHADAEDMYQDAFLKAMGALSTYDVNRAFQPWFDVILINTCKNFLVKKRPTNFSDLAGNEDEEPVEQTIVSEDRSLMPEEVVDRKAVQEIVGSILSELPDAQREATVLFYYNEQSVKQIAKVQGVSEDTVKSRLNYARRKVGEAVDAYAKKHEIRLYSPFLASAAALYVFFRTGGSALLYGAGAAAGGGAAVASASAAGTGTAAGTAAGGTATAKGAGAAVTTAGAAAAKASTAIGVKIGLATAAVAVTATVGVIAYQFLQRTSDYADASFANASVGDVVRFGSYEQDNSTVNGPEDIEWLVAEIEGDEALLISVNGLDNLTYGDGENTTWENSEVRDWLNDDFFDTAFTSGEQERIVTSTLENDVWVTGGGSSGGGEYRPGQSTSDRVFLLSKREAEQYFGTESHYLYTNRNRMPKVTPYAAARGAFVYEYREGDPATHKKLEGYSNWWLRTVSPRENGSFAYQYDYTGYTAIVRILPTESRVIRPVIRVTLEP